MKGAPEHARAAAANQKANPVSNYLPAPVLPDPSPELSPLAVVMLQLEALQNNDLYANNAGIRLAFKYASPANRAVTGPIERYIHMVKNPLYRSVIGFQEAQVKLIGVNAEQARLYVDVRHTYGETAGFVWIVSRQTTPPYDGCWMTDSVLRVK